MAQSFWPFFPCHNFFFESEHNFTSSWKSLHSKFVTMNGNLLHLSCLVDNYLLLTWSWCGVFHSEYFEQGLQVVLK